MNTKSEAPVSAYESFMTNTKETIHLRRYLYTLPFGAR